MVNNKFNKRSSKMVNNNLLHLRRQRQTPNKACKEATRTKCTVYFINMV